MFVILVILILRCIMNPKYGRSVTGYGFIESLTVKLNYTVSVTGIRNDS